MFERLLLNKDSMLSILFDIYFLYKKLINNYINLFVLII